MVEKNLGVGDSSQVASLSSPKSMETSVVTKTTEGTNEDDNSILEKTACASSETPMHQELPASLILIDNNSNLKKKSVEQKAPSGGSITGSPEVDNSGLPSIKEDSNSFRSASNEDDESKEAINDNKSNLQEILFEQKAPIGCSITGSSEVDSSGLLSVQEDSHSFPCASNEFDESKEVINDNKSNLQEILVEQKAPIVGSIPGSSAVDNSELPTIKEDSHSFPSASNEVDESKEAINDKRNLQEIFVEQKSPIGGSITGSSEVDNSGLPSIKQDSHSFLSACNEVDESKEAINDNKSNQQEILVEQKAPIGGSITGSSEVDNYGLPSLKENSHSFLSASNEVDESKESINDNKSNLQKKLVEQIAPIGGSITGSSEVDNSGLQSIKEDSHSFPSPSNEVDESKESINDNKSNLQGIFVEEKAPIGGSTTGSLEVDNSGLPSIKEGSHSFPSASNEVDESKEAINDLLAMQSSGENTHATSQTSASSKEDVQCAPLHKVQDGASCSDSEKTACEGAPAILAKVKEDKPRVMHRWSERQMSLRDTRQKVPTPVRRLNSGNYSRTEAFVDTTKPIESVKMAATRFGGSMSWKTRRTQPVQVSDHVKLEASMLKNEISECKQQAEAAEVAKLSVLNEIERTKKLIEDLKHDLERAQHEEADAKEDLDFLRFIVPEIEEGGVNSDDSVAGKEILKNIQERHEVLLSKLNLVNDELKRVREDYASLLIEQDISIGKSQAAVIVSKEADMQAEELTEKLDKLKEVLDLARATCHDAEEQKMCASLARDEDRLKWEKDLRQAEEELSQLGKKLSSVEDLKSKLEASSDLLLKLNKELTAYLEAKITEEAQQGSSFHEEIILSRNELEEHMKSIDKVRDEICALKVAAASLQSELSKEKEALATMQQLEAMALITISSLKVENKLAQQELEALQAKEKKSRDRMCELPRILQAAALEADEAKSVALKAQEMLRMSKEETEQAKAGLSSMELRLQAALKETEAAKESERLSLDALRALEESELAANIAEQGSPRMITLDFHEHASLVEKSRQAEALVHERTSSAIAQVEMAKESELLVVSSLGEVYKVLEERKQALLAATKRADAATEGKVAMEQELRTWREEHGQRRKAGEASRSETKPSNTVVVIAEYGGETKGTCKEDSCALVHPLSDMSARSRPAGSALREKTNGMKKLPFLRRMMMFLARRRLKAAE